MDYIESEAKKIALKLLEQYPPETELILTILGYFSLYYPYQNVRSGREIGIKSEHILNFLKEKGAVILHKSLPPSHSYPVSPPKFIISYNRSNIEDFLNIISYGDFSWDKRGGIWKYKHRKHSFRPGTGGYRLIDMFMESPNKHFTAEEIVKMYSSDRNDEVKRTANDIIRDIKKPLGIPGKYFIPGDGYTFNPYL